jgi:predicted MPP superfamily phosphohydrolase
VRWESVTAITLGAAAVALLARGIANTRHLQVSRETVVIPELPAAFDGFTLLHLTDLHLRTGSHWPERLLALTRELAPDCVCFTGDFIMQRGAFPSLRNLLQTLTADVAHCFAVFGNADYRPQLLLNTQRTALTADIPFLRNTAQPITRDSRQLWFAGVEDPHDGFADLGAALADVPSDFPVILLAHSPEIINETLDPRIRLVLSGHTHGGQMCLPGGFAPYTNIHLPRPFVAGRHQVNGAVLYVSRGIGSTRIPLRYNCEPEATLFTLTRNG